MHLRFGDPNVMVKKIDSFNTPRVLIATVYLG